MILPVRLQRSRQAGSFLPPGTLYCGRPSLLGNPWTGPAAIAAYRLFLEHVVNGCLCVGDIEAVGRVERVFQKPIRQWTALRLLVFDLVGQWRRSEGPPAVACWCGLDQNCHADVIAALPHLWAWNNAGLMVQNSK